MTKHDLARWVSRKHDLSSQEAEKIVDCFFESMSVGLNSGKRVELRGFGIFSVRDYDGYIGRDPRTGDPVPVQAKKMPFFKTSKDMKEALNNQRRA